MLYSLCFPTLPEADNAFIHNFRQQHDLPYLNIAPHHFTMAFGLNDVPRDAYIQHVRTQVVGQERIKFVCRYAMLGDDDSDDNYYVFLVPDEGYSDICRLHDRLYRGALQPFLRVEIPYIPHIGIASIADPHAVRLLCDTLNARGFSISGSIDCVSVCEFDGRKISELEKISFL